MVQYHDEPGSDADSPDPPPSYEIIAAGSSGQPHNDAKSPLEPSTVPSTTPRSHSIQSTGSPRPSASRPASWASQSNPSSWLSMVSFTSSRASKQVRQTVLALIRDLVLNIDSPDLLDSCADACRTYGLDLSALLQEPFIEHRSVIYWGVLNRHDTLLPALLAYATPLSQSTLSEIRLACLATSNQALFQSLRCQREPFTKQMTPLSTRSGTDTLVLGSMPADEVSIHEMNSEGTFVAKMRINLWQKRMRVSGRVSVEFIARGRIWSLTFFSASDARTEAGMWQVALCLLEHSPPTFIDSRLVIDILPPPSTPPPPSDLISLSPVPDDPNCPSASSFPPPSSPSPPDKSKSKSKAQQRIEMRLKSPCRLAHRPLNAFLTALDATLSSHKDWSPPQVEQWTDKSGSIFTNAIVVPLDGVPGGELLYASNTPFFTNDGTLHARLEAWLGKPDTDCVLC